MKPPLLDRLGLGNLTAAVVWLFLVGTPALGLPAIALSATADPQAAPRILELTGVELAAEPAEQERGLMYRRELCPSCGMLFDFGEERRVQFWMKNTSISLDMLFVAASGEVVTIHERTVPFLETPPYATFLPARYVIEVNAGWASKHHLAVGNRIDVAALRKQIVEFRWVPATQEP